MHIRLLAAAVLALLLTACGSSDDNKPRPTATAGVPTATRPPATATQPVSTATSAPTNTKPPATATSTPRATDTSAPTNTVPPATATATPQATDTSGPSTATATATATVARTNTSPPATATATPEVSATPTATPTQTPSELISVRILEPANGSTVTTVSFTIRAAVDPADAVLESIDADLNGTTIGLSAGTVAGQYVAQVGPSEALEPDNILTVTAIPAGSAAAVSNTVGFHYDPQKSVARRISDPADLISGPLADGRVGDYLLANSVARFIIQDAPQRDLYSVGAFGGNIIDAELVGHPGLDNFLEIQPAVHIETVINAQTVEIVNDGLDGTAGGRSAPAVPTTCSTSSTRRPSSRTSAGCRSRPAADDADYDVEGCTEYSLAPGEPDGEDGHDALQQRGRRPRLLRRRLHQRRRRGRAVDELRASGSARS